MHSPRREPSIEDREHGGHGLALGVLFLRLSCPPQSTEGGPVILTGTVRSWVQKEEAERAACSAAGVRRVDDRIEVEP